MSRGGGGGGGGVGGGGGGNAANYEYRSGIADPLPFIIGGVGKERLWPY